MDILAARQALLQSMKEAEEISKSLQKSSLKLLQIEKSTENLEHVMTPLLSQSTEFEHLAGYVDRAIEPADYILEALQSIREMETVLMDDPLKDLQKYAKTMADLEEQLSYIKQNYPTMVEALLGAFHAVGENRISDTYKMYTLKETLQGLEIDPQSFIKIGSEIVDSALEKLETTFMSILAKNTIPMDLHGENCAEMEGGLFLFVDMEDVGLLQMIAEMLESFGRAKKCLKIYGSIRIESMRASFKSMAADYLRYNSSSSIDKLEWTALEDHVAEWLVVLTKTVKVLVSSERKLCCRIFETFDKELWTDFFGKLVLGSGLKALIEFGEAVALSQREPQKLFKLLDMVEGLETLKEDFGVVFEGPGCLEIRLQLCEMEKQLVHSACQVLWNFGKQVEGDSGLFADGSPPQLTSYVVNYLKFMMTEYELVMAKVWGMENNTSLAEAVSHVMDSLELSLEIRAKGYNTSGLAHIFLMNNYWYIFKRARDSKLGTLLDEAWLKQRKRLVHQHVLGYEKDVWVPLVKLLNRDGLVLSSSGRGGAKDLFKQRIRSFNSAFEKLYEEHKNWVITDEELREGTYVKIVQAVIPAYRSYTENFSKLFDPSANGSKLLRYTPEQLEFMLTNLFTQRSSRTGLSN
jgi:exocyst complex protein 7